MSFAAKIGQMIAKGPLAPMTEEQTKVLITLTMLSEDDDEFVQGFYNDVAQGSPLFQIFHHRCTLHIPEMKAALPALMWLGSMVNTPGHAVLMVALIKYLLESGRNVTLNTLINQMFPYGIPTEANLQAAWDAQKVNPIRLTEIGVTAPKSDNMLDLKESWE